MLFGRELLTLRSDWKRMIHSSVGSFQLPWGRLRARLAFESAMTSFSSHATFHLLLCLVNWLFRAAKAWDLDHCFDSRSQHAAPRSVSPFWRLDSSMPSAIATVFARQLRLRYSPSWSVDSKTNSLDFCRWQPIGFWLRLEVHYSLVFELRLAKLAYCSALDVAPASFLF